MVKRAANIGGKMGPEVKEWPDSGEKKKLKTGRLSQ